MEYKEIVDKLLLDKGFNDLKTIYQKTNFFQLIRKSYLEEIHSNFICWLLNPMESHELGDFPLKLLLQLYYSKQELNQKAEKISKHSISESDFLSMRFETEKAIPSENQGRIDVYGENDQLILVIENKIKSLESQGQTVKYYKFFKEKQRNKKKYFIYLSPTKNNCAMDEHYINITYQELFDYVIQRCLEYPGISIENRILLEQYSDNLSRTLLNDHPLACTHKKLCALIYGRHEKVFELFREIMQDKDRDISSYVCKVFDQNRQLINEILLSVNKPIIIPNNGKENLMIKIEELCDRGIIIPGSKNAMFFSRQYGMIFIIQVVRGEWKRYELIASYSQEYSQETSIIPISYNGEDRFISPQRALDSAIQAYWRDIGEEKNHIFGHTRGIKDANLRNLDGKTIYELYDEMIKNLN